jgi:DNA-binding protein H-NS
LEEATAMVSKRDLTKFLSELEYKDLVELKSAVQERIDELQAAAKENAKQELQERAKQLGFDLGDLFPSSPMRARRTPSDGVRASPRVKYRNPKNHEEVWSGRGRQAKWLTRELASGKKLDDFLVE